MKSCPIFATDDHLTSSSHPSCSRGQTTTVEQRVEATLRVVVQLARKDSPAPWISAACFCKPHETVDFNSRGAPVASNETIVKHATSKKRRNRFETEVHRLFSRCRWILTIYCIRTNGIIGFIKIDAPSMQEIKEASEHAALSKCTHLSLLYSCASRSV